MPHKTNRPDDIYSRVSRDPKTNCLNWLGCLSLKGLATIRIGDKKKYLGCFPTAALAAAAYDKAKIALYGNATKINGMGA